MTAEVVHSTTHTTNDSSIRKEGYGEEDAMEIMDDNTTSNNNHDNDEIVPMTATSSSSSQQPFVFSPELLRMYYIHLFPYHFLYHWLSYGDTTHRTFTHREFSFTIDTSDQDEIYLRYQSFINENEFKNAILKRCPKKIDIGAIYTTPPKDKAFVQNGSSIPEQRELIFDIDMDDYTPVRNCGCIGAQICTKCWTFMSMAMKVLDTGLREDFGYEHIAWFYSGRRGVHCWVCDPKALQLTNEARGAITKYFQVDFGSDKNKDGTILPNPMHPMLERSFEILEPMFIEHVLPETGHALLVDGKNWCQLLNKLPDGASVVREKLASKWLKDMNRTSPSEKWDEFKLHIQLFIQNQLNKNNGGTNQQQKKAIKTMTTRERNRIETIVYEIVFYYTYPRLDIHVSMMRNHLLKAPFCVHPKSGRVCVPIRVQDVDEFDPFMVPTLTQLKDELDEQHQRDLYEKQQTDELEKEPTDEQELLNDENKIPNNDTTTVNNNNNDKKKSIVSKKDVSSSYTTKWEKTSLAPYYVPFQKEFLDPLTRQMKHMNRDHKDQLAANNIDF